MPQFVKDVEEIRQRASRKIEEGAVTDSYRGDVTKTVNILNEALATEIVCILRYMHHYFMATGVHGKAVSNEFKEHADAEREHADRIGERIQQLGGKPDFNPRNLLERSVSQYVEGEDLADMIREDLIAERIVIEVYQDMIRYFGDNDPTTRTMLEGILEDEEEHASDLVDLLYVVNPETGETSGEDPGTHPLTSGEQPGRRVQRESYGGGSTVDEHESLEALRRMAGERGLARRSNRGVAPIDEREALQALQQLERERGEQAPRLRQESRDQRIGGSQKAERPAVRGSATQPRGKEKAIEKKPRKGRAA